MAGLIVFGFHLVLVGYLAYRSGYVRMVLGVLLDIAGAGCMFDSVAAMVIASALGSVASVTFLGESSPGALDRCPPSANLTGSDWSWSLKI